MVSSFIRQIINHRALNYIQQSASIFKMNQHTKVSHITHNETIHRIQNGFITTCPFACISEYLLLKLPKQTPRQQPPGVQPIGVTVAALG